jgi:RNA polymerase sigma-70 factor, ECF subfamily
VTRNRAIAALRNRRPYVPIKEVALPSPVSIAEESIQNIQVEKVRRVIALLPSSNQQLMELAYVRGMSHSEISEETGDPLGTVKTKIRRSLIEIKETIAPAPTQSPKMLEPLATPGFARKAQPLKAYLLLGPLR